MKALTLIADLDDDGRVLLKSPGVGYWRSAPSEGQVVAAGQGLGVLEVLGRRHELKVPGGIGGAVLQRPGLNVGHSGVAYGQVLAVLVTDLIGEVLKSSGDAAACMDRDHGLVFRTSSSGRFYSRPGPGKATFVSEGDVIETGHTVFLLEVMKTFSRVTYSGDDVPSRARVLRILLDDGDDIDAGQAVLVLEAV